MRDLGLQISGADLSMIVARLQSSSSAISFPQLIKAIRLYINEYAPNQVISRLGTSFTCHLDLSRISADTLDCVRTLLLMLDAGASMTVQIRWIVGVLLISFTVGIFLQFSVNTFSVAFTSVISRLCCMRALLIRHRHSLCAGSFRRFEHRSSNIGGPRRRHLVGWTTS